jgi:hypothetical protein
MDNPMKNKISQRLRVMEGISIFDVAGFHLSRRPKVPNGLL